MSNKSNYNKKLQAKKKKNKKILISSIIAVVAISILVAVLVTDKGNSQRETANLSKETDTSSDVVELPKIPEAPVKEGSLLKGPGVTIIKSDITEKASFYPYEAGGTYMEVIAIRASDGTVRTALNTCQVCTGSGRGYYVQEGDVLICQNCGNRFTVDQVEVVKGGCNPVPIFAQDKTDAEGIITISDEYLNYNKALFINWKLS